MNDWKHPGDRLTLIAPSGGTVGREGYLVGSIFVIAFGDDAAVGEEFVGIYTGVMDLKKTTAQVWADGDLIYWDNAAKEATNIGPADAYIGVAEGPALTAALSGFVVLNGIGQAEPASASLFVSTPQTGTGGAQLVAHGLGVIPSAVTVQIESGHDGAAGVGDLTPLVNSDGTHTITNAEVTVTAGALFKVTAYV